MGPKVKSNRYFFVGYDKELVDSLTVIDKLAKDRWVGKDTVLINCAPDYSSRLTQLVNHKLSYLNTNELFETINLELPYPNMSQVWNAADKNYQHFDKYLIDWVRLNMHSLNTYLFINISTVTGRSFSKLKSVIKARMDTINYRFCTLYLEEESVFIPDYFVEMYDKYSQGGLLFEWENTDNPNWNY